MTVRTLFGKALFDAGLLRRLLIMLGFALLSARAYAVCYVPTGDFDPLEFGAVMADASIPIGAHLNVPRTWDLSIRCDKKASGDPEPEQLDISPAYGIRTGTDMWNTTLSGVAMRVYLDETVISGINHTRFPHPGDGTTQIHRMAIELIKVGPVRPSHFTPNIFTLTATPAGSSTVTLGTKRIVGTWFPGIACTVDAGSQNKEVDFGIVTPASFSGIGSTAAQRQLQLLLHCDNIDDPIPTPLSIKFDGVAVNGHRDLLQVDGDQPATGIGIRVKSADTGTPFTLKTWNSLGITGNEHNKYLNLQAEYYQYADQITPGDANGTMTFTIDMR